MVVFGHYYFSREKHKLFSILHCTYSRSRACLRSFYFLAKKNRNFYFVSHLYTKQPFLISNHDGYFCSCQIAELLFFYLKISHHFPLFIIFLSSVTAKIRCRVDLVKCTLFVNHSLASLSLFIDELLNGGCRFWTIK